MFGGATKISDDSSGVDDLEKGLNALKLELTDEQVMQIWQQHQEEYLDLKAYCPRFLDDAIESKGDQKILAYRVFNDTSFDVDEKRRYLSLQEEVLDEVNLRVLMPGVYYYDSHATATVDKKYKNITRIPDEFFTRDPDFIKTVRVLILAGNKIRKVSSKISLAIGLIELDLQHNYLQHVPVEVFNLPKLRLLRLNNNRLICLPGQLQSIS